MRTKVAGAAADAKDEVWAEYRYVLLTEPASQDGLRVIDLGAGHSSANESLSGRVLQALRQEAIVNETFGGGYLDRHWPPAFEQSGEWPLLSLRQAFVNGNLTRLIDPETAIRMKIAELIENGEFGLASHKLPDGTYERMWFQERVPVVEIAFESDVYLLRASAIVKAQEQGKHDPSCAATPPSESGPDDPARTEDFSPNNPAKSDVRSSRQAVRIFGELNPETWNRFGTRVIPKLRSAGELKVSIELRVDVDSNAYRQLHLDLTQVLDDLNLEGLLSIEDL